jgi:hypothetical protein
VSHSTPPGLVPTGFLEDGSKFGRAKSASDGQQYKSQFLSIGTVSWPSRQNCRPRGNAGRFIRSSAGKTRLSIPTIRPSVFGRVNAMHRPERAREAGRAQTRCTLVGYEHKSSKLHGSLNLQPQLTTRSRLGSFRRTPPCQVGGIRRSPHLH